MGIELSAESIYEQLLQIAPTAVGKWNGYPSWREHFNFVTRVLGKENEAKIIWNEYDRRIEELKTALGDRVQDIEVSLVSTIGSYMSKFSLTLWAWELTGSATALALVGFFSLLPQIFILIFAGIIVESPSETALWMEATPSELQGRVLAANSLVLELVSAIGHDVGANPLGQL